MKLNHESKWPGQVCIQQVIAVISYQLGYVAVVVVINYLSHSKCENSYIINLGRYAFTTFWVEGKVSAGMGDTKVK